jgi:hypothetical protein
LERRVILILSIIIFFITSSMVTGVVRLLDTLSPDECGDELCLTVKTDQEIYTLHDRLTIDVFLSNNGNKEYRGSPPVVDIDIYNASQAVTRSRSIHIRWASGGRIVPGTKTKLFTPPPIDLNVHHEDWGDYPFHPGLFTIIVRCHHPEYVVEGNTTFAIRE